MCVGRAYFLKRMCGLLLCKMSPVKARNQALEQSDAKKIYGPNANFTAIAKEQMRMSPMKLIKPLAIFHARPQIAHTANYGLCIVESKKQSLFEIPSHLYARTDQNRPTSIHILSLSRYFGIASHKLSQFIKPCLLNQVVLAFVIFYGTAVMAVTIQSNTVASIATSEQASLVLLERASHALGDGWKQVRAIRVKGTAIDESGSYDFTWVDGWTESHHIKRMTRDGKGPRFNAPAHSSLAADVATPKVPKLNLFRSLITHAPAAAILLALQDQQYQVTAPFTKTEETGSCAQIITPSKSPWDGGVFALLCFSKETGLPTIAKVAIPYHTLSKPLLFETIQFEGFVSQDGLLYPSQLSLTRPGQSKSSMTIKSEEFGTVSQDLSEGSPE